MQQVPGPGSGPLPPQPDPGALALHSLSDLGEIGTIATAQLIGGLSGLLVSEGLARVVRDILGVTTPTTESSEKPAASEAAAAPGGEGEALAGLSARALKELVAQGVAGRIIALNSVNTYLSLAAAEQLRRIGSQLATGEGLPPAPRATPSPTQVTPHGPQTAPPAPPVGAQAITQPFSQPQAFPQAPVPGTYHYPSPGPVYWSQVPPSPPRWR